MSAAHAFEAEIKEGRGGGALIEVPFSVRDVFGTGGQVRVVATFDGRPYRGSLAPMGGGVHILGVRKDIRDAIGKGVGDTIAVTIEGDTQTRAVDIPPELVSALRANPEARARFESLSYTHRREYAEWVGSAKKQETKDRRAARAVELILGGKTR